MSNIARWNILPGNNTDAPPDGAPENMLRSAVNNVMREMMAATARWYGDSKGVQIAGGTANALTLNSVGQINTSGYQFLTDIPVLTFRAGLTNTGPVTLNVDGLGVKNFFKAPGGITFQNGEIVAGQLLVVGYNATGAGQFELIGPAVARDGFASNTVMLFYNITPPVGWTKQTLNDDIAIRVVAGTTGGTAGGTLPVSAVFTTKLIDKTNMPVYDFDLTNLTLANAGTHAHDFGPANGARFVAVGDSNQGGAAVDATSKRYGINDNAAANTGQAPTAITSTLNAGSHTHGLAAGAKISTWAGPQVPMDFSVKYMNCISAVRT